MKVLDLQCRQGHTFEGWFGSEDDFQSQHLRNLVECPMCGDKAVSKKLSAPRLNLGAGREPVPREVETESATNSGADCADKAGATAKNDHPLLVDMAAMARNPELQAAWLQVARKVMAQTEDVGSRFAQEARKIHYGEAKERGIRGEATRDQTLELLDEGINVMLLPLPASLKNTLQ